MILSLFPDCLSLFPLCEVCPPDVRPIVTEHTSRSQGRLFMRVWTEFECQGKIIFFLSIQMCIPFSATSNLGALCILLSSQRLPATLCSTEPIDTCGYCAFTTWLAWLKNFTQVFISVNLKMEAYHIFKDVNDILK